MIDKVGFGPSSDIDNAIEREQQYRKNLKKILFSTAIFFENRAAAATAPPLSLIHI